MPARKGDGHGLLWHACTARATWEVCQLPTFDSQGSRTFSSQLARKSNDLKRLAMVHHAHCVQVLRLGPYETYHSPIRSILMAPPFYR